MPIYLYWGEDDFAIAQAVKQLQKNILDPNWIAFNYHKLPGDRSDTIIDGLNQAMTPVFGSGGRLIWLTETNLCQNCTEDLLSQLQKNLPRIPEDSHLLFTSSKKPDGRLKSTKLFQEYARILEFSFLPPWETERLILQVKQIASSLGIAITPTAVEMLANSVGNNTRQLWNELEKLSLYYPNGNHPIDDRLVADLVICNTQNSLQLAKAILQGDWQQALGLIGDLLNRNEPALKIIATLTGQFRTWTIVKLAIEAGEKDIKKIAQEAEIGNPNRIYFLRKEIERITARKLLATLPILLDLEFNLKRGSEPLSTLQTQAVKLCQIFS
jgi:DNA polymerase-3 subunit delta